MSIPIILASVRSFLLVFVFNYEIPSVMIEEHHEEELIHYFHHIYAEEDWKIMIKNIEEEVQLEKIHQ